VHLYFDEKVFDMRSQLVIEGTSFATPVAACKHARARAVQIKFELYWNIAATLFCNSHIIEVDEDGSFQPKPFNALLSCSASAKDKNRTTNQPAFPIPTHILNRLTIGRTQESECCFEVQSSSHIRATHSPPEYFRTLHAAYATRNPLPRGFNLVAILATVTAGLH
jgi:hypothetical protein